jgi:chlorobactene glucosyltransferase
VPGSDLPDGWFGKNHALDVLAREASGTFIVFIDVDTVIEPTTISQLVGYGLTEQVDMVSVLPSRHDIFRASTLFGHLRYFWELVLSTSYQPAASGALWMIRRHVLLDECGGMEPLRQSVVPESDLAKKLGTQRYHCLLGASSLGVSYEKKWRSQIETSIRLLLPRAGNAVGVAAAYLLLLGCVVSPLFIVATGLMIGWSNNAFFAVGSVVGFMALYAVYLRHMWTDKRWMIGVVLWPVVIVQECVLLALSIVGYVRGTITWKGRPIRRS